MPGHAIVIVDHRAPDLVSRCLAAAGAADEVVVAPRLVQAGGSPQPSAHRRFPWLWPSAVVVPLVRGGGDAALAPSPALPSSARGCRTSRGCPPRRVGAVLAAAAGTSWAAAQAERLLPGRGGTGLRTAARAELWRRRRG